ncbi:hypothetical protein H0H92_003307, partial [Tricholoma furcatifolium]
MAGRRSDSRARRSSSRARRSSSRARRSSSRGRRSSSRGRRSSSRGRRSSSRGSSRSRRQSVEDPLIIALRCKDRKGRQGKERDGVLLPYVRAGKLIPRIVDTWMNIESVIILGLERDGVFERTEPLPEHEQETPEEKEVREARENKTYQHIISLVPNSLSTFRRLADWSLRRDEEVHESMVFKLIEVFCAAAKQARIADTAKLNSALCELMVHNEEHLRPPVPHERITRGWEHFDTARFLCPGRLIQNFNEDLLAQLKAGEISVTAYDFPFFMYDAALMSSNDPRSGLCRGFLLIRIIEEIFFGSGRPRISKHATKEPIGEKYGINTITPEIIAYAGTQ